MQRNLVPGMLASPARFPWSKVEISLPELWVTLATRSISPPPRTNPLQLAPCWLEGSSILYQPPFRMVILAHCSWIAQPTCWSMSKPEQLAQPKVVPGPSVLKTVRAMRLRALLAEHSKRSACRLWTEAETKSPPLGEPGEPAQISIPQYRPPEPPQDSATAPICKWQECLMETLGQVFNIPSGFFSKLRQAEVRSISVWQDSRFVWTQQELQFNQ